MADGPVNEPYRVAVLRAAIQATLSFQDTYGPRYLAADLAYRVVCNDGRYAAEWTSGSTPMSNAAPLPRDIVGNPFRPAVFDPTWRTSTAVGVAQATYDARDFASMPVLADALEEAGCDDADVLAHCRSNGPHVRGCWVVDLILGKT